jgi:hypothetical protein
LTVDPAPTGPTWTAKGDQAEARLKAQSPTVGDLNRPTAPSSLAPQYHHDQIDVTQVDLAAHIEPFPSWLEVPSRFFGAAPEST